MQYRNLGRSGLKVSVLGLGTMTFGENQWGLGGVDQPRADRMVAMALDYGMNFFDTADVYAMGESEQFLGRALGSRRHEVVLATKARSRMGSGVHAAGLSRKHLYDAVHQSLRRLKTDYIDLYQLHGFDAEVPMEETLETLHTLVQQGWVRYIGLSNFAAWQMAKAVTLQRCRAVEPFISAQMHYSLVNRDIEHEVVPAAVDLGLGLIVWSPLSGGFLSGKYRSGAVLAESRIQDLESSFPPFDVQAGLNLMEPLAEVAERLQVSMASVSLAWVKDQPGVSSVLIGARKLEQLEDNLEAADLTLAAADQDRLASLTAPKALYPGWMIQSQASGD